MKKIIELHIDSSYGGGYREWYINKRLDRTHDQPAYIWDSGMKYWYEEGIFISSNSKEAQEDFITT